MREYPPRAAANPVVAAPPVLDPAASLVSGERLEARDRLLYARIDIGGLAGSVGDLEGAFALMTHRALQLSRRIGPRDQKLPILRALLEATVANEIALWRACRLAKRRLRKQKRQANCACHLPHGDICSQELARRQAQ